MTLNVKLIFNFNLKIKDNEKAFVNAFKYTNFTEQTYYYYSYILSYNTDYFYVVCIFQYWAWQSKIDNESWHSPSKRLDNLALSKINLSDYNWLLKPKVSYEQ